MKNVTMYTGMMCPFCSRAKRLLSEKGVSFHEIDVTFDPTQKREMVQKAGATSVPQIWIGDHHVGGSDELATLERSGKLDALLAS